ncbi:DUF4054 domain-containing protein [Levilactobacillus brevis]|uniref:DUF4054 domain-containing protein n=1 Tax=Levilactobacillus brevis TaxID=1580 RepID=UPI0020734332|nr:DUF4054 domain-containing protein [Levilactobacillus brevis]
MDEADKSTIQNVRLIRSNLSKVSDDTIQLAIDDAWTEVQNRGFPAQYQEQACRYLAASLISREDDRVSLKQVGDLKKQYFKGVNAWADRYKYLLSQFGDGGSLRIVVI